MGYIILREIFFSLFFWYSRGRPVHALNLLRRNLLKKNGKSEIMMGYT